MRARSTLRDAQDVDERPRMLENGPRVFISYQRGDEPLARRVREHLVVHSIQTWMDQYDIPPGAYWPDEIDKGLASSDIVVGILSPDAVASRNVKNEWDWALQNDKRLLLLLAAPCVIPHRYVSINFLDASTDPDAALDQLVATLAPATLLTPATQDYDGIEGGRDSLDLSSGASRAAEPLPHRDEPFIGRERETQEAMAVLDTALRGQRQLLLVAGEPGIGKTRLAEEVAHAAIRRDAQVFWGRCYEWEGAPPYWPWIEIVRAYAESRNPAELARELGVGASFLVQIVPELAVMIGGISPSPAMGPEQMRFRLFDAVARLLRQAAAERPFVAVLDDLHWADEASLRLLEFVVRELGGSPILLLGTYRDTEVRRDHPLGRSLAALTRAAEPRRIMLKGFTPTEVGAYIHAVSGVESSGPLVEAVSDGTDGNPFYLGEVMRLLQSEGRLDQHAATQGEPTIALPESVRDVVGRRLDRLSAGCNAALSLGAVIGRTFTLSLLERASGQPATELLDLLDEAADARVIELGEPFGAYRFSHAFIQQTLYDELSTVARLRLHNQVGSALEVLYASEPGSHASELAHHFSNAPIGANIRKAIDYALEAGANAAAQVAWETAVVHYTQVLQLLTLLDVPDELIRCDALIALGEAHYYLNAGSEEAVESLRQAGAIARKLGSPEHLARAAISMHGFNIFESYAIGEQGQMLREALDLLDPRDSALRARLLAQLAVVEWTDAPTLDAPCELCDQAIAMARRLEDAATLAFALAARHVTAASPDNLEQRLADAREVVQLAEAVGDPRLSAWGHFWQRSDLLEQADTAGAHAAIDATVEQADRLRAHVFECVATETRILRAFMAGTYSEAQPLIERVASITTLVPEADFWAFRRQQHIPYYFVMLREQERLAEIDAETQVFRGNACTPIYRMLRLLIDLELGYRDEALAEWSRIAAHDIADIPRDAVWLGKLALLTDICCAIGDDRRAYVLMQMLTPYAARIIVDGPNSLCYGAATHYLGMLARSLGDWELAEGYFESALDLNDRVGLRPLAAWTRCALAGTLLRRPASGDRQRALMLLDDAMDTARRLGMLRLQRRSAELRQAYPAIS